jgi:Methyltransferase domain
MEIGVFDGEVLAEIAQMYPDKMCYGIDPFIEDGNTSWLTNVAEGGTMQLQEFNTRRALAPHTNVKLFKEKSQDFNKNLTQADIDELNISCIFVDGDHRADAVLNDCELAMKLLGNNEGIIIFDDWNMPSVADTVLGYFEKFLNRIERFVSLNVFVNTEYETARIFFLKSAKV